MTNSMLSMAGKKIFIVGGGSCIGAAPAGMAAKRGAPVGIVERTQHKLYAVAAKLGARLLSTHVLHLSDANAVQKALSEHGLYDYIVTTAAQLAFKPFAQLTDADIGAMLASKFWGAVNLARAAVTGLKSDGSLLFFSGAAAYRAAVGTSIVGAANLMLESLAQSLALELRPRRVNVISLGLVDSPTWAGMSDSDRESLFAATAAALPVGRIGQVDDLAHAALAFLENGFITGSVMHVDGGARVA
jgi:NAD(P)-dependent dehydrogenase (short-subunit alcohol dehydrogenase family)